MLGRKAAISYIWPRGPFPTQLRRTAARQLIRKFGHSASPCADGSGRIGAQMVEVISVFRATGDGGDASAQTVIDAMGHKGGRRLENRTAGLYPRTWRVWLDAFARTGWLRHSILERNQRVKSPAVP